MLPGTFVCAFFVPNLWPIYCIETHGTSETLAKYNTRHDVKSYVQPFGRGVTRGKIRWRFRSAEKARKAYQTLKFRIVCSPEIKRAITTSERKSVQYKSTAVVLASRRINNSRQCRTCYTHSCVREAYYEQVALPFLCSFRLVVAVSWSDGGR